MNTIKVKALPKGNTLLTGKIKTMAGESLDVTEIIGPDASRIHFGAYLSQAEVPIPQFDAIFGRLGYAGSDQWRIYYHFAHHFARMA